MLKMRVLQKFTYSGSPYTHCDVDVGDVVVFENTKPPSNRPQATCTYHGSGSSECRHLVVSRDGRQYQTGICMEDARLYFTFAE